MQCAASLAQSSWNIAGSTMAEDKTAELPKISVSRTSTGSIENRQNVSDDRAAFKASNRGYAHNSWRYPAWRSKFDTQPWHAGHDPDLKWHIPWKKDCFATGRVLIIDYVGSDSTNPTAKNGKRHVAVAAQEFENLVSYYTRTSCPCLSLC